MYGFIGIGNMGASIVESFLSLNNVPSKNIIIYDNNER